MTTDYPYSLAQLAQILSALENERRNPNTKRNAIKAIERAAAKIGLTAEDVFDAADGLLSGRIAAGDFLGVLLADPSAETGKSCVMPNGELLMVPTKTSADSERSGNSVAVEVDDEPAESDVMPNAGPLAAKPRTGTKQARMIAMLRRPEGATVEQIAEAMGWQRHTVRGAISGALKKKLGLTITSEKTEGAARVYRIIE
jgi:hypothetical protein